jgi:hypothetical protein
MKRLWIIGISLLFLLLIPFVAAQEATAEPTIPAPTPTPIMLTIQQNSSNSADLNPPEREVVDPEAQAAPHFADGDTYALVWVERANLRTEPSTEEGRVVDIALAGETFRIIGAFYPEENAVEDPDSDFAALVYDDPNEREVWYLVAVNGGAAWIFGGVVLVANPASLPIGLRELTAEEEARLQQQLYEISGTIAVRNSLRIRSGPGAEYRVVGVVQYGGRVAVMGRNEFGTWAYINYKGTQGWVSSFFLAFPSTYQFHLQAIIR